MKKSLIFYFFTVFVGINLAVSGVSFAQAKKKSSVKKKRPAKAIPILLESPVLGGGGFGSGSVETPKYLSLEPCGKETPAQIAELENAKDAQQQVQILSDRLADKDQWTRGCAIYRLGTFKSLSSSPLPLIIKLLRDDRTDGIFSVAEEAVYKIPPPPALQFKDLGPMTEDTNVYNRLYATWAIGYYNYISGSFDLKQAVDLLIAATRDEDSTVRWFAVEGIRRIGFQARAAVPALTEMLQKKNTNIRNLIFALARMEQYMLPAAPLLFDVLYHTDKYESDGTRQYMLYISTAVVLAKLGKELIPLLETEFDKEPFAVLEVAEKMGDGDVSPLLIKGFKHPNKEVRQKALGSLYSYSLETSMKLLQPIMTLLSDIEPEVKKAALNRIGSIARHGKDSPELARSLREKVLPVLIKMLSGKDGETVCYTAFTIGDFGAEGEKAIPALVRMMKQKATYPNNCAVDALFELGEKGRKFLSKEKIESREASENLEKELYDYKKDEAKPIKPKPAPTVKKVPDTY